ISLTFEIDADADDAKLQKMIETTERYCVIFQTLRTPPTLSVKRAG
ncbi:MAG: OsmC family protein, partial [Alphaproteobacteria bacterium]|nr:OsmC family protein [Alphaproteobacteria bacterium]